eukprot:m.84571 g.84571  ORF g.84571 m.84571 type:complete len:330 (+) comp8352_c0_seq1:1-990(+)
MAAAEAEAMTPPAAKRRRTGADSVTAPAEPLRRRPARGAKTAASAKMAAAEAEAEAVAEEAKTGAAKGSTGKSLLAQMRAIEARVAKRGFARIAGTDEAGRGPLAGPVVAAACYIPQGIEERDAECAEWLSRVADSKVLDEAQREELFALIEAHPEIETATCVVEAAEIDEVNILQASMLAMHRAVSAMPSPPDFVLVDGPRLPWGHEEARRPNGTIRPADPPMPAGLKEAEPIVKGDARVLCIAAASIVAKVTRDRIMVELDAKFPAYGLAQHKGYPTAAHMAAVRTHGASPVHRMTFAPLKTMKLSLKPAPTTAPAGRGGRRARRTA